MNFYVGQIATQTRTLTQEEFDRFAALSGDDNPIHVDPEFSARTRFGKTVAHGMFLYSLICGVIAENFPGAVQVSQDLMFPTPSFVGEQVMVSARVLEIDAAKNRARVETLVTRPGGEIGCQGETVLRLK
ncbi:MAG: MaoC family dehydratase [Chloroflexota bacterium]